MMARAKQRTTTMTDEKLAVYRTARRFYAGQRPRGYPNETVLHVFGSAAFRDQWVAAHRHDGDCNSDTQGAWRTSARWAREVLSGRGDAATTESCSVVAHTTATDFEPVPADFILRRGR